MDDLEYKYRKNKLSKEELLEFRKQMNSMSADYIEKRLHHQWMTEDIDTSSVTDARMDQLKYNIDVILGKKRSVILPLYIRIGRIAAAVLLPAFMITTFYLYHENNQLTSEEMIVSTAKGERANVTLPDGTLVALNSESKLIYIPKIYNKMERKINFDGEGYFNVHKDQERPFLINAKGMQVKVLGTKFNLSAREHNNIAELALEEGSVSFLSTRINKNIILKPAQKAILDRSTGYITIVKDEYIDDASAWRRGDMVFRNTEFLKVIKSIEDTYNVNVKVSCKKCLTDQFTGTVPNTNLNEVLEVIERSYHLKATITGKEVILNEEKN